MDQCIGRADISGRYLGFTNNVSAKMASTCWQNAVIFLTHPENLRKKAQWTKSRQLQQRYQVRFHKQAYKINHEALVGRRSQNKSITINQINEKS